MPGDGPKLRDDLQPVRARVEGRDAILLRDPLGLSSQVIALGSGAVPILSLLDGTRSVADLRMQAIRMRGGDLRAGDEVEALLAILDERRLLDNEGFREAKSAIVAEWRQEADRPCSFAGSAYPEEPGELSRFLDDILQGAPTPLDVPDGRPVAIVAPHVDIKVGWALYGAAYALLSSRMPAPDRIVLLGTGHTMHGGPMVCPTPKHYVTPLGRAQTDVELARRLEAAQGADDFAHRGEHSLEFQVVFLQHVFAERIPPLVPVLCGDAGPHLDSALRDVPGVGPAVDLLRGAMGSGALAVAGADLCHVGPKFGDGSPASALLKDALSHETDLIDALVEADLDAFWSAARRSGDRHRVCGLSSLAILLSILPEGTRGVLLGRDVMRDHDTSSAVGYASLAFLAPA